MPGKPIQSRPLLVLDVGGVLLTDPMPILFDRLAEAGGVPKADVYEFYRANLRQRFWSGAISEDEFWPELLCAARLAAGDAPEWHAAVLEWQTPLPAIGELERWAAAADIEILSNHRTAWIRPALEAAGVALPPPGVDRPGLIRRALVSEETGLVKPDADAFRAALEIARPDLPALLADDQPPNVASARAVGLPAILADDARRWVEDVDRWLEECARDA